ncbi:hypothetical protein AAHE18_01G055100 [Arachis hypogaea]
MKIPMKKYMSSSNTKGTFQLSDMVEKAMDETTLYASGFATMAVALSEKKEKTVVDSITKNVVTDLNRRILKRCHFRAKNLRILECFQSFARRATRKVMELKRA